MDGYVTSLRGRRALVTGSSQGIGRSIALGLAQAGASVCLHGAAPSPELDETLAEAQRLSAATAHIADLSGPGVSGLVEAVGPVDILVLCAATQIRKSWQDVDRADIAAQVAVNVSANLELLQGLVPHMQQQGWGRILFVGSIQATRPHPQMPIYALLKSGLENLMRNLARDLAPSGVTANMISPGVILTARNRQVLAEPDYRARVLSTIPVGRLGEPQDCAGAAILFCSDAAGFITGCDLPITGGGHLA